jgi:hypothetical protein
MNRITAEEAKQFVPLKNDMKSDLSDAAYYTFTPSDRGEDWEDVTYYLPRRKRMYEGRTNLSQECIKLAIHHMKM